VEAVEQEQEKIQTAQQASTQIHPRQAPQAHWERMVRTTPETEVVEEALEEALTAAWAAMEDLETTEEPAASQVQTQPREAQRTMVQDRHQEAPVTQCINQVWLVEQVLDLQVPTDWQLSHST
jgi:hypothetical protein